MNRNLRVISNPLHTHQHYFKSPFRVIRGWRSKNGGKVRRVDYFRLNFRILRENLDKNASFESEVISRFKFHEQNFTPLKEQNKKV